jgi:hypothetical protein
MKEFMGFFVLTGPLFPFVIWLIICLFLVKYLITPKGSAIRRRSIKLLVIIFLAILPFSDEIIGRAYLAYLCGNKAGTDVYKTVELPAEFWDKDGNLTIFNEQGYINREFWLERIDESNVHTEQYSSMFDIDKRITYVGYKLGDVALGRITTFAFKGGWVSKMFSANRGTTSCQFVYEPEFSRRLYSSYFRPTGKNK